MYAKLNLTLGVGAKEGKFHPIDSLVTSVDVYDEVEVASRADKRVTVCGTPNIPNESNTAYLSALKFIERFGTCGVDITIQKHIPLCAGMGGSSADASAVVYCMCKLFGVDIHCLKTHELCADIGSDVNFMLHGGLARMRGKGDNITFATLCRPLYFALTTFNVRYGTAQVYSAYDELPVGPLYRVTEHFTPVMFDRLRNGFVLSVAEHDDFCDIERQEGNAVVFYNDLQQAMQSLDGYAKDYVAFAKKQQWNCCMTGSGSAYFVPFTEQDEAVRAVELLSKFGFDTRLCRSADSGVEEVRFDKVISNLRK